MLPSALVLLGAAAAIAAIVTFTAIAGLTGSLLAAAVTGAVCGTLIAIWLARHPALRPRQVPTRGVRIASAIAAVVVVVQLARLTVFIVDATETRWSVTPWNAWLTSHSCVSAYWSAAREVRSLPDLYGEALNTEPSTNPSTRPVSRKLGGLYVDPYEYPPTFLLLPRALMVVVPDFFDFRRLWFALNLAVVTIGLVAIARRLEGPASTAALWLSPVVLAPLAITSTLQVGNVQLACIALAMLGMLAMEERDACSNPVLLPLGALALAFATVSKLYPGMLVVYLCARRRWRAAAWTTAWGVLLALIGLLDLGLTPHRAFLEHLPRLLSGEAFAALSNPGGVAGNMSVPGIVFKLGVVYGVPHMSFDAARIVGWLYTLATVAIAVRFALRPLPSAWEPLAWLSILILATLRSPLLPPYGAFPPLWLAVIILAAGWNRPRDRVLGLVMVAIFTPVTPAQSLLAPTVHALVTLVQTIAALLLVALTLRLTIGKPSPSLEIERMRTSPL